MRLTAFMLLVCAQEAQRSAKERDEPVRIEVQSSPLPDDAAHVREQRKRDEAGRFPRREPRELGFADRAGSAHDLRTRLGISGASFGFSPELEDRFRASDDLSGSGSPLAEELFFDVSHHPDGHGLGLFASRSRLPPLLRSEFDAAGAEEFAGPIDDRFGIDGWLALGSRLELYGRAEQWSDHADSGGTLRARATWRDVFGPGGPLQLETFVGSGRSVHATGLRASGHKRFAFGGVGLSWDATDLDDEGIDEKLLQHAVRADIDFALGKHWSLGVYAQSQFGDEQDALSLGFALQLGID